MDRITIDLENCYGIKRLSKEFDFSKTRAYAIYAPNGAMKTSLAHTFQDIASDKPSSDRIFPKRVTVRKVTDETGHEITAGQVLVVEPYNDDFGDSKKTCTLLLDPVLKKEITTLYAQADEAKDNLLGAVKKQAQSKKDFESEIAFAFTSDNDEFELALGRIKTELENQKDAPFAEVPYDKIFDEKIVEALDTKDLKDVIEDYVKQYNELLAASTFFKKGIFDYYNAAQTAKALADNGFFNANHTVTLYAAGEKREIKNRKELEEVISKEKDAILKDKKLSAKFDAVAKQLDANVTLREFRKYLLDNEPVLAQLNNVAKFRQTLLKSYLKKNEDAYVDLMKKYEAAAKRRKEIEEEARKQRTQWETVIEEFNARFFVPFTLEPKNRTELILGNESIIDLDFTYHDLDGKEDAKVEKGALLTALSTGERKAFYILQVLFEIETRKKENRETLVIVDDLADSFDYQNKYAIIQYLKDISEAGLFKQLIMTHNFDFFRTIESRFVGYSHCLMAAKVKGGIALEKATGIKNVFVNDWKKEFFTAPKKKIASIPFLRNLIEFTRGDADPNFVKLTSLLHWKADTAAITVGDLDAIYIQICGGTGSSADVGKPVCDLIKEQAQACLGADAGTHFENKIVLAIAIRLGAEQYMAGKINDPKFVAGITGHQTQALTGKFKKLFPTEAATIATLDRVSLMTPENIHLNSFMYEPIIDMSDEHLKRLYKDVTQLV